MISNIVFSSQSDPIYYIKWALSILNRYALYLLIVGSIPRVIGARLRH